MNKWIVLLCFMFFKGVVLEDKLNIAVYFESLCPDSYKFIKEQLQPSFKDIASYVDLNLVPFGKSSRSEIHNKLKNVSLENRTEFSCHHGPQECKGNKILSCAIHKLPDQVAQVEFTTCFMDTYRLEKNDESYFGQKSAEAVGLKPEDILKCYNSEEGLNYQLEAEESTVKVAPKFVPTIIYNGKFDQKLLERSLTNFKEVVCEMLQQSRPETCK